MCSLRSCHRHRQSEHLSLARQDSLSFISRCRVWEAKNSLFALEILADLSESVPRNAARLIDWLYNYFGELRELEWEFRVSPAAWLTKFVMPNGSFQANAGVPSAGSRWPSKRWRNMLHEQCAATVVRHPRTRCSSFLHRNAEG